MNEDELIDKFNSKFDEIFELRKCLTEETDRGVALMVASYLEGELEHLLKNYFIADKKVTDELLSQSGPLGTFSSRIDITYALGLIGSKAHRDLHLLRKIRNDFGHSSKKILFSDSHIIN